MNIPGKQVQYRRRIGSSGRRGVYGIGLVGGLHLVAADSATGDGFEILGMGSHPLLARHLAKRHLAGIEYHDMAKSETIDARDFQDLLPHWAAETEALRAAAKGR